jgi:hypothetical protein
MRRNHPARGSEVKGKLARDLCRVLLGTGAILLVPLAAMRFTREVNWSPLDFLAAAVLLAGFGGLFVLMTHKLRTAPQRRAVGGGLLLTLLLVWLESAVGIFGSPLAGN